MSKVQASGVVISAYGSRSIRHRRDRVEILGLMIAMHRLLAAEHPMTARQVFYLLVRGIRSRPERRSGVSRQARFIQRRFSAAS